MGDNRTIFLDVFENKEYHVYRLDISDSEKSVIIKNILKSADEYELSEKIEYSPDYKLEKDQVYEIVNYVLPDRYESALKDPLSVPIYKNQQVIKGVFVGNANIEDGVYIESISASQFVSKKGFLLELGSNTHLIRSNIFEIKEKIDALYKDCSLYFRYFSSINSILDLDEYYQYATDEGVNEFIGEEILAISDTEFFMNHADKLIRRYILKIQQREIFKKYTYSQIRDAAVSHKLGGYFSDDKIIVPSDKKKIKMLLKFLKGDVYNCDLSNEVMITNSSTKMKDE